MKPSFCLGYLDTLQESVFLWHAVFYLQGVDGANIKIIQEMYFYLLEST